MATREERQAAIDVHDAAPNSRRQPVTGREVIAPVPRRRKRSTGARWENA